MTTISSYKNITILKNTNVFRFEYMTTTETIRVDEELLAKLDARRGDKKKSDFYREILENYVNTEVNTKQENLNTIEDKMNTLAAAHIEVLKSENTLLREDVVYLRSKLNEATLLIGNEQTLHLHTQRMLPEPKTEHILPVKKWWQFWK